jgi:hypothetical protein
VIITTRSVPVQVSPGVFEDQAQELFADNITVTGVDLATRNTSSPNQAPADQVMDSHASAVPLNQDTATKPRIVAGPPRGVSQKHSRSPDQGSQPDLPSKRLKATEDPGDTATLDDFFSRPDLNTNKSSSTHKLHNLLDDAPFCPRASMPDLPDFGLPDTLQYGDQASQPYLPIIIQPINWLEPPSLPLAQSSVEFYDGYRQGHGNRSMLQVGNGALNPLQTTQVMNGIIQPQSHPSRSPSMFQQTTTAGQHQFSNNSSTMDFHTSHGSTGGHQQHHPNVHLSAAPSASLTYQRPQQSSDIGQQHFFQHNNGQNSSLQQQPQDLFANLRNLTPQELATFSDMINMIHQRSGERNL